MARKHRRHPPLSDLSTRSTRFSLAAATIVTDTLLRKLSRPFFAFKSRCLIRALKVRLHLFLTAAQLPVNEKTTSLRWSFHLLFYEAGFLESEIRTTLFHSLESFCRNAYCNFLSEFRDKECLVLEVYLASAKAYGIVFSSTNTVGIS